MILLAAHGSPDPRAQALAHGLRKGLERRLGEEVLLGFIELVQFSKHGAATNNGEFIPAAG